MPDLQGGKHRNDPIWQLPLGVPFGIDVDSVSIRRVEIESAVRPAVQLRAELHR